VIKLYFAKKMTGFKCNMSLFQKSLEKKYLNELDSNQKRNLKLWGI